MSGDVRETHVWFDGSTWFVYSERAADRRRFERWFGPPARIGRNGATAHWKLPGDALAVRRKARRAPNPPTEKQVSARAAFAVARRVPAAKDAPEPHAEAKGAGEVKP